MTKKSLNIEYRFISIMDHENHDKENNTMALVQWWVFGSACGLAE